MPDETHELRKDAMTETASGKSRLSKATHAFKAAWESSKGPRGRHTDPALYSRNRVTRRLPFKFQGFVPFMLWILVLYNTLFLCSAIESVLFEWWTPAQGAALCFMFISFPFTVFVWICSDLHERRKTRLGPKRVVITAGVAFFLLMFAMALWLSCTINPYGPLGSYCPNFAGLTVPWGWWYGDLVPFLPFMAVLDMVFYAVYLATGVKALICDHENKTVEPESHDSLQDPYIWQEAAKKSAGATTKRNLQMKLWRTRAPKAAQQPDLDCSRQTEVHAKYATSRSASHTVSFELPTSGDRSVQTDLTHRHSLYDSSVADISENTSVTMEPSTGGSSSLVTTGSARSSALLSSFSSAPPAYSERGSTERSLRQSAESDMPYGIPSQPSQAHLR